MVIQDSKNHQDVRGYFREITTEMKHIHAHLRVNYQLPKVPDHHCWQLSKNSFQFAQKQNDWRLKKRMEKSSENKMWDVVRCQWDQADATHFPALYFHLPQWPWVSYKELQYQEQGEIYLKLSSTIVILAVISLPIRILGQERWEQTVSWYLFPWIIWIVYTFGTQTKYMETVWKKGRLTWIPV